MAPDAPAMKSELPSCGDPKACIARNTVLPAIGTAAASTKSIVEGMRRIKELSFTAVNSAHVPPFGCGKLTKAMRSPSR